MTHPKDINQKTLNFFLNKITRRKNIFLEIEDKYEHCCISAIWTLILQDMSVAKLENV